MASYQSILDNQPEYISPINLGLLNTVMGAKQGRYDQNLSKYDQVLQELKLNENLLVRDKDKEYFANTVQSLIDTVNAGGKIDWSNGGLTRQITNHTKKVLDDDYILQQMGISSSIRNFSAGVAKKQEKGDGSYSEINHNDAIKQAGLDKYMAGVDEKGNPVDSIGNLQYKDYINAPKVLNETVSKWAKDHGYQKQVDSQGNDYFITTTTREVLSKGEILNFMQSTLDPSLQGQLQINARHTYGGLGEDGIKSHLKERTEVELVNYEKELAKELATSKTSGTYNEEYINNLKNTIQSKRDKIQNNSFDPNEIYGLYQKDLFNGIAEAYDRNTVVDIDYSTVPLEIAKFEMDKAYKAEMLQLKKYELDKKNSQGVSQEVGTAIPEIPQTEEEKEDNLTQVRQSFLETQAQLRQTLEATDPDYQALETKEAKQEYMLSIVKNGGTVNPNTEKPLSLATVSAANNHRANYDAYLGYKKEIVLGIDNQVTTAYNDLLDGIQKGSDLKVENLGRTMPNFSKALKSKKQFSQLTAQEKEALRYEFISNAKAYGGDSNNEESYQLYLDNIKQRKAGKNNPLIQEQEQAGYFSGIGNTIAGVGQFIAGTVSSNVGGLWQSVFQGERAGREARAEGFQQQLSGAQRISKGRQQILNFGTDLNPLVQDTNVTELEGRDTGSGQDIWLRFKEGINASKKISEEKLNPYVKTMPEKMSYSFSTESKEQKPTAIQLQQIALKNGGVPPADGANNFNLSYDPKTKQFAISYLIKAEKGKAMSNPIPVDEQLMPKDIRDRFRTSQENWNTSIRNPKAKLPPFTYKPPMSMSEAVRTVENLNVIAPNTFSEQEIHTLKYNPLFFSPEDRFMAIAEANPSIKESQNQQQALTALVNSTFEVVPVVSPNVGFFADVFLVANGQRKRLNTKDQVFLGQSYDAQDFLRKQLAIVGQFTNQEIDKIKKIQ